MGPLLWWFIFVCLIILITVLSLHLCCSRYRDNFKNNNIESSGASAKSIRLNKYKFEKADVEDLTCIEKNFLNFNPNIKFVNEVNNPIVSRPSTPKINRHRRGSLLHDIHEINNFQSNYSVEDIVSGINTERMERRNSEALPRRFSLVTEGMRKNSAAAIPRRFSLKPDTSESLDTLDCLDPIIIETKRDITNIEEEAQKVVREIDCFLGETKNLKFFEINEKLIRLSLALNDLECTSEELRMLKREVQSYINSCKEKLNNKVV